MVSEPVLPSFDGVRLATSRDLTRMATVAAAGFFWSPTFRFQRPYYAQYPEDTVLSYWKEYHAAILDPACVVLVAEDAPTQSEGESVYEALKAAPAYSQAADSSELSVVVGVASINIKPGSRYIGQFQTGCHADPSEPRNVPGGLSRDQCPVASAIYHEATSSAKARHLAGQMRLATLAVHPAYWRRGHATRLVNWCVRLADLDGVPVGISAVPMGATLAAKAGFEERDLVRVKRSTVHAGPAKGEPKGELNTEEVELWVAIRSPIGSPTSSGSATTAGSPQ